LRDEARLIAGHMAKRQTAEHRVRPFGDIKIAML
jgi:hypothetical protein